MSTLLSRNIILINQEMIWAHLNSVTSWIADTLSKEIVLNLKFLEKCNGCVKQSRFHIQGILQRKNGRGQPRGSGIERGTMLLRGFSVLWVSFYRLCVCKIIIRAKSLKEKGKVSFKILFFLLYLSLLVFYIMFSFFYHSRQSTGNLKQSQSGDLKTIPYPCPILLKYFYT